MMNTERFSFGEYEYSLLEDGTAEITKYTGDDVHVSVPAEMDGHAVASVGNRAFRRCSSLERIVLPEGLKCISTMAFRKCSSLREITLPEGLVHIADWAFWECSSLEEIAVPSGVTSIGCMVFRSCSSLRSVRILAGVTEIFPDAFSGCSDELIFTVVPGSYGERWCRENDMKYTCAG